MNQSDTARAEAVAWLVGRLRFEQLLADLQRHTEGDAVPADASLASATDRLLRRAA